MSYQKVMWKVGLTRRSRWRRRLTQGGERCSFISALLHPQIKQSQDEEKKQLTALRELIKDSLQLEQKEVGHPQLPR